MNEIVFHLEETKLDSDHSDSEGWVKLNHVDQQNDEASIRNTEPNTAADDSKEEHVDNDTMETQMKDYNSQASTDVESNMEGDISDDISIISETEPEDTNILSSQNCEPNVKIFSKLKKYQEEYVEIVVCCTYGMMIGLLLMLLMIEFYKIPPNEFFATSNETLITSRNIINMYKELAEVKAVLSEIEVYTKASNYEFSTKDRLTQIFKIINSSKIDNNLESLDSNLHSLNQLQLLLQLLSPSIIKIDDTSGSLKNEMNKTLNIVNNVKAFYETLILFKNNTQDENNLKRFLQNTVDKINGISRVLFSNLSGKIHKETLNVYNKYAKLVYKLREKLCHLKKALPDNDKFITQLIENNQLFENYEKSCFSNYSSKNFVNKTAAKTEYTKHDEKSDENSDDSLLHVKHDENSISKIHNNNSFLRNESNKTENVDDSTIKIPKNANDKVNYTSKLPEEVSKTANGTTDEHNKTDSSTEEWCHLENIFNDKLLKLIKNDEGKYKNSINLCERIIDVLGLIEEETGISKDSFNNILVQNLDIPSHENNYYKKDNDVPTCDIAAKNKVNDRVVIANEQREMNVTKSDHEDFAEIPLIADKNKLKNGDSPKSNVPTNTISNNNNADSERKKPFKKVTKHISQINSHRESKRVIPENKQRYMERDSKRERLSLIFKDFPFEHPLKDDSDLRALAFYQNFDHNDMNHDDWYTERARSRENARDDMDYDFDWYTEWARSRKNARQPKPTLKKKYSWYTAARQNTLQTVNKIRTAYKKAYNRLLQILKGE